MITGKLKFYQIGEAIRLTVHDALTLKPNRSSMVPGAIAWDDCSCDGGMLAVSMAQVYLSNVFPQVEAERTGGCDAAWEVVDLVVQVIRCSPGPDNQGNSPTTVALDSAAMQVNQDAEEMMAAVAKWICEFRDTTITDGLIVGITAQGPEGDCVGNEMHVLIGTARG